MADSKQKAAASQAPVAPPNLPLPFISVPEVHNFRSIGSYSIPSNGCTRSDLIFRSAELSSITPAGIIALQSLGISTIYDLRSQAERRHAKALDIPGVDRIVLPVFPDAELTPAVLAERMVRDYGDATDDGCAGFARSYADILDAGSKNGACRRLFEHVRDRPSSPFLVHCTAGKDRTGVVCALALSLAGVEDSAVAEEYALTEIGLSTWMPRMVALMMKIPAFEQDEERVRRALGSRKEYMLRTLKELRENWGSIDGYFEKALEFAVEDIDKIRQNLREPAPGQEPTAAD